MVTFNLSQGGQGRRELYLMLRFRPYSFILCFLPLIIYLAYPLSFSFFADCKFRHNISLLSHADDLSFFFSHFLKFKHHEKNRNSASVLRIPSLGGYQFLEDPLTFLDVMWSLFWPKLNLTSIKCGDPQNPHPSST